MITLAVLLLAAAAAKPAALSPSQAAKPPGLERVPGLFGVAQVATGFGRACARFQSGVVSCWEADPTVRTKVPGLTDVIDIAVSDDFACALTGSFTVKCWGNNDSGQLGDGTTERREEPVDVLGVQKATAIGVGLAHACALLEDGTAKCWGGNGSGETGDGTNVTPRSSAVDVRGLGKTSQMALARANRTSCARLSTGEVRCWGKIAHEEFNTPVAVQGLEHVAQIAVALDTFCARMEDLSVRCWGGNNAGQVGDGRTRDEPQPVPVEGVSNAVDIIPGADHTCALIRDFTLRCWGGVPPTASPDTAAVPLAQRIVSLALEKRRILRIALMQTPNSELSLYAVADDGTVWWVAAPERRLSGRWLGLTEGGPFTTIVFRATPGGFDSKYEATGTAPAPDCQAPRCASRAGESGEYSVRGQDLVLSSPDHSVPDSYRFELTPSTLALTATGFAAPFKLIRACDSAEACDSFGLSRAPGKGAWQCEKERCFWVGAPAPKKKKSKK